jgi:SAM-dependent methyltransferase
VAQTTSGLRSLLSNPLVYDAFQSVMGASRGRRFFVDEVIRPGKGARILDIGCGTADILGFLPPGVEYWGYDISPEYIESARSRFGSRGVFQCGNLEVTGLAALPPMDAVLGIGVLHHLEDEEAIRFFRLGKEALAPGGRVITIDPVFAAGQNPLAKYLISHDRGRNVREAEGYRRLASEVLPTVRGTVRHTRWIPYTHWIMECFS